MKRKMKKAAIGLLAGIMTVAGGMTAFAGTWQNDEKGWWYQNDDGSYYNDGWHWIDGNNDGTSESYYFTNDGYALTNTRTPDGYMVNGDGAWVENGTVKTKETFWTKMHGIRIKYNPAFSNISRQIFEVAALDIVDYYGFGTNGLCDTYIKLVSGSRKEENDAIVRQGYYDEFKKNPNYRIAEYDLNGSHWVAGEYTGEPSSNGITYYNVSAATFTAKNEYVINYSADASKEHLSVEELLNQIVISDDRNENWSNAEKSSMQLIQRKDGSTGWNFRLKQQ